MVAAATEERVAMMSEMSASAASLAKMSEGLQTSVSGFKLDRTEWKDNGKPPFLYEMGAHFLGNHFFLWDVVCLGFYVVFSFCGNGQNNGEDKCQYCGKEGGHILQKRSQKTKSRK